MQARILHTENTERILYKLIFCIQKDNQKS